MDELLQQKYLTGGTAGIKKRKKFTLATIKEVEAKEGGQAVKSVISSQMLDIPIENIIRQFLSSKKAGGALPRTLEYYAEQLEYFREFVRKNKIKTIGEITKEVVERYMIDITDHPRSGKPHSLGGRHAIYRPLRTMVRWWSEQSDGIYPNPTSHIKIKQVQGPPIKGISEEDFELLLKEVRTIRDKAILLLLLDTGMRAFELLKMDYGSVDFAERKITFVGKGNKTRTVFFTVKTRKALRQYIDSAVDDIGRPLISKPHDPLFISDEDTKLSYHGLRSMVERLCKRAGIKTYGLHSFRRAFGLGFIRNNGNVFALKELMGHSRLETTTRYVALTEQDLKAAHEMSSPLRRF